VIAEEVDFDFFVAARVVVEEGRVRFKMMKNLKAMEKVSRIRLTSKWILCVVLQSLAYESDLVEWSGGIKRGQLEGISLIFPTFHSRFKGVTPTTQGCISK